MCIYILKKGICQGHLKSFFNVKKQAIMGHMEFYKNSYVLMKCVRIEIFVVEILLNG